MLARNVPNGRLAPDLSKVGKLGFAERFGGGLISLFFHCPPPYILKAARPRAMLARNLRPIHRTPKRKRQPGMGQPLNNGQTQNRHRRHSPSSSPGDRYSAKSTETETGQLRTGRDGAALRRYSVSRQGDDEAGLGKPVRSSRLVARTIHFLPRQSVVPRFLSERNV